MRIAELLINRLVVEQIVIQLPSWKINHHPLWDRSMYTVASIYCCTCPASSLPPFGSRPLIFFVKPSVAHFQLVWWSWGWFYPSILAMDPWHKLGWWLSILGTYWERDTLLPPGLLSCWCLPGKEAIAEEGRDQSGGERTFLVAVFRGLGPSCTWDIDLPLDFANTYAKKKSLFNLVWFELVSNSCCRKSPDKYMDRHGKMSMKFCKDKKARGKTHIGWFLFFFFFGQKVK